MLDNVLLKQNVLLKRFVAYLFDTVVLYLTTLGITAVTFIDTSTYYASLQFIIRELLVLVLFVGYFSLDQTLGQKIFNLQYPNMPWNMKLVKAVFKSFMFGAGWALAILVGVAPEPITVEQVSEKTEEEVNTQQ